MKIKDLLTEEQLDEIGFLKKLNPWGDYQRGRRAASNYVNDQVSDYRSRVASFGNLFTMSPGDDPEAICGAAYKMFQDIDRDSSHACVDAPFLIEEGRELFVYETSDGVPNTHAPVLEHMFELFGMPEALSVLAEATGAAEHTGMRELSSELSGGVSAYIEWIPDENHFGFYVGSGY